MVSLRPVILCLAVGVLTACGGSDSTPPVVAGPPATITKTAGDNQTADPGTAVAVAPSVTVKDAQGVPVPGVVVTFSVGDGSGILTNATPLTDASGVATLGSWKLGTLPGAANTVVASVATATDPLTATFTATATGTNPCSFSTVYTIGTTVNGTFATTDCPAADGSFIDFYTANVTTAGAYVFNESAAFDTYLILDGPGNLRVAENDDATTTTQNSSVKVLLAPANYLIVANTFDTKVTGDYTISSAAVASSIENCEDVFIVRGVTTAQTLASTDCSTGGFLSDDMLIFIPAGQSITVSMNSTDFDAYLEIYSRTKLEVSNDDVSTTSTNAQVTFTATTSDYYLIAPTSKLTGAQGVTGAYTLIVQ